MKKSELKEILKPLIKQCVKETLLEEGILSNIVSEVARGLSPLLIENRNNNGPPRSNDPSHQQQILEQQKQELEEEKRRTIKEQKIKVLNATGFGNEIFEGVRPIRGGGKPDETPAQGALAGIDPEDAGVDISGIMALGGRKWNKLI